MHIIYWYSIFMSNLFNISNSDYIMSTNRMRVDDELEKMWPLPVIRYCLHICLDKLRRTMKKLRMAGVPIKIWYKHLLLLEPTCLVVILKEKLWEELIAGFPFTIIWVTGMATRKTVVCILSKVNNTTQFEATVFVLLIWRFYEVHCWDGLRLRDI